MCCQPRGHAFRNLECPEAYRSTWSILMKEKQPLTNLPINLCPLHVLAPCRDSILIDDDEDGGEDKECQRDFAVLQGAPSGHG